MWTMMQGYLGIDWASTKDTRSKTPRPQQSTSSYDFLQQKPVGRTQEEPKAQSGKQGQAAETIPS
jgi:hypothetical protein